MKSNIRRKLILGAQDMLRYYFDQCPSQRDLMVLNHFVQEAIAEREGTLSWLDKVNPEEEGVSRYLFSFYGVTDIVEMVEILKGYHNPKFNSLLTSKMKQYL